MNRGGTDANYDDAGFRVALYLGDAELYVKYIDDGEGNSIPVPMEFYYAGGTKNTGFVISDVEGDDLDNSKSGNQFVWIPVDNINDYARTDFGTTDVTYATGGYSIYSEEMPTEEQASVEKYKGFYIGRYESGDENNTTLKTFRASDTSVRHTVTIKKGQIPYNFITLEQSRLLAEEMTEKRGYTAKTRLTSSYAWDTTMNYIKKTNSEYLTLSNVSNYVNLRLTYIDIVNTQQTKAAWAQTLFPTGRTPAVNNIYDLSGNLWEWTTEGTSDTVNPRVRRGGAFTTSNTDYPAVIRHTISIYHSETQENQGFRVTLYM